MSTARQQLRLGTRGDLAANGAPRSRVEAWIADGTLVPIGDSWLGTRETPLWVRPVLADGLRLTCVDALSLEGVQVPVSHGVHAVGRRSGAGTVRPGVVLHPAVRSWTDHEPVVPRSLALRHAGRCLPPRDLGIVLDSVAHLGLLGAGEIEELLAGLPARTRRALGDIEPRAESATESRVIRELRQLGVRVRPQWQVPGVGRTDMLVGERLLIECDSVAHHTARPRDAADRRRDRQLVARGYLVIRLTWEDVMLTWPDTWAYLLDLIRREVHRLPRSRRGTSPPL